MGYEPKIHIPQTPFWWDTRMPSLIAPHERALTLLFSELASAAARQTETFLGSPGSLAERTNETDTRYWVHRYSDAAGRRQEAYLGKSDDPAVSARIAGLRQRITAANSARRAMSTSSVEYAAARTPSALSNAP